MSIYNDIRNAIADKIENDSKAISKVYRYSVANIEGYPAVVVRTADNEGRFHSTDKDGVVFSFSLFVYYPLPQEKTATDQDRLNAEKAIGDAVSEIVFDLFGQRDAISEVDWVKPVNSVFSDISAGERPYLSAEVSLQAKKFVSNQ